MAARKRGSILLEAMAGLTLAGIFLTIFTATLTNQALERGMADRALRARAGLQSAYEEFRAGLVAPPAAGETVELAGPDGVTVTAEGLDDVDARLTGPDLAAVRVRVTWTDVDGRPRDRTLTTVVARGGP